MAQQVVQSVRQLAARLEDATSSERIQSLEALQTLAKQHPSQVSEIALQSLLDVLQERGSAEEYLETLNVLDILIKSSDSVISLKNVNAILSEGGSVELLLDLLDHSDSTVGVMASQILTQLQSSNSVMVESMIQNIPDGMNKLLQRLPDSSREAVRDQALVLVQKLTANSEEMKKTLVFNEGIEVLFGIIQKEYDSEVQYADKGPVVQDCLQIMANTLNNSETCQRFFFGMGADWAIRLAFFFDPALFESPMYFPDDSRDVRGAEEEDMPWFQRPGCVRCATLALQTLSNASSPANPQHQALLGVTLQGLIPAALYPLARNGPVEMVESALELLYRLVEGNEEVARGFTEAHVKVTRDVAGVNVPGHYTPLPERLFGFSDSQMVEGEDGQETEEPLSCINVVCLLAERYIHAPLLWNHSDTQERERPYLDAELSGACLRVLEAYLAAGGAGGCTLLVQTIIAPPPPPPDAETSFDELLLSQKTALGPILSGELVQSSSALLTALAGQGQGQGGAALGRLSARRGFIRTCNLLSLVFVHGGEVSRELFSTLSLRHVYESRQVTETWPQDGSAGEAPPATLSYLAYLLSTAARLSRAGAAVPVVSDALVAVLRLLAAVVSGCSRSAMAVLADPSNMFLMDLASATSENAGVPLGVRAAACLFLGACCNALPEQSDKEESGVRDGGATSSRRDLLQLVERGVTLKRLSETLREPLDPAARDGHGHSLSPEPEPDGLFHFSPSFRRFFDSEVEAVMKSIYQFYAGQPDVTSPSGDAAGVGGNGAGDGVSSATKRESDAERAHREVVELQSRRIAELEERLSRASLGSTPQDVPDKTDVEGDNGQPHAPHDPSAAQSILIKEHESTIAELQRLLKEREASHAQLYKESQERLQREDEKGAVEEASLDLKSYIVGLEQENAELKAENGRLEKVGAEYQDLQGRYEALQHVQEGMEQVRQDNAEAGAAEEGKEAEENERLRSQVAECEQRLVATHAELEGLQAALVQWEAAVTERDRILSEIDGAYKKTCATLQETQQQLHEAQTQAQAQAQAQAKAEAQTQTTSSSSSAAPSSSRREQGAEADSHNPFAQPAPSAPEEDPFAQGAGVSPAPRVDPDAAIMLQSLQRELADKDRKVDSLERELSEQLTATAEAKRALQDNQEVKTAREALVALKSQLKDVTRERNELKAAAGTTSALAERTQQLEKAQAEVQAKEALLRSHEEASRTASQQAENWRAEAKEWESEVVAARERHEEEVAALKEALSQASSRGQGQSTPTKTDRAEPSSPDPASSSVLMSPIPLSAQALQLETPLTGMTGISEMSGMGSKSRFREALTLLGGSGAQQREISRLTAEVTSERRRLQALQDTHNDLLSLLAQEELELGVFRELLESVGGEEKVAEAMQLAQRCAVDKYGSYVNLHDSSAVMAEAGTGLDFGEASTTE